MFVCVWVVLLSGIDDLLFLQRRQCLFVKVDISVISIHLSASFSNNFILFSVRNRTFKQNKMRLEFTIGPPH